MLGIALIVIGFAVWMLQINDYIYTYQIQNIAKCVSEGAADYQWCEDDFYGRLAANMFLDKLAFSLNFIGVLLFISGKIEEKD